MKAGRTTSGNSAVYDFTLTSGTDFMLPVPVPATPKDMPAEVDIRGGVRGKYYERIHGIPPGHRPSWKRGIWANG